MSIKNFLPKVFGKEVPVRQVEDDPFVALQRNMNRMFDDYFRDFGMGMPALESTWGGFSPNVDMRETEKEIKIQAELPGLDEKNIDISLSDNRLTISGEKKQEKEEKDGNYHRIERSYGSFRRDILLPCEVEQGKVEAVFKNGVLNITLPKCEAAIKNVKKIPVKAS